MTRRILFVHNHPARFVQIDLALLRERYDVREWYQRGRLVNFPALASAVRQCDLLFGWFASWHTFPPLLLARAVGRPAILVVGGYDTANMPEIAYGHQRGGFKRWVACRTMHLATALIANSSYAKDEAIRNARVDGSRVTVIYHGLADGELANGNGKQIPVKQDPVNQNPVKQNLVITVANVDKSNLRRKGLEAFTRAAALAPELAFALIGPWRDDAVHYLRSVASPNIQFTGWLGEREIGEYFTCAQVYVQASRHEAFGLALAEAMLHGCVPVVTKSGGLPEVVGDTGIYIEAPEPACVVDGIRKAFRSDERLGKRAQERIRLEFSLERRRSELFNIVERTIEARGSLLDDEPSS